MKKLLCIAFLSLLALFSKAQNFEIKAVNKGEGIIGVQVRVTSGAVPNTTNNITDLVFGLKWKSSYNVELVNTITTNYNIVKSDTRKEKNGFYFQAFSASNTPFLIPANWTTNTWVEIMSVANTRNSSDTGTFQICEQGFDNTTDPNFGLDLTDFSPSVNGIAFGVVLPLVLTKFDVSAEKTFIRLAWSTSSEINNKGFEIQRSVQETSQFDSIGWVNGTRNSNSVVNYGFQDKQALAGIQYYYRLKILNYNGKFGFSKIKSSRLENVENKCINISPNPTSSFLHIIFLKANVNGKVKLRIIDSKGSSLMESQSEFAPGRKVEINVSSLSGGQYYLVLEQEGNIICQKPFQKQ